jgi:hypothetical protein
MGQSDMKRSSNDLFETIDAVAKGKGRNRRVRATCPFCPFIEVVDAVNTEILALVAAKDAVLGHIKSEHPERIEADAEK